MSHTFKKAHIIFNKQVCKNTCTHVDWEILENTFISVQQIIITFYFKMWKSWFCT